MRLEIKDLNSMKYEFLQTYQNLFRDALNRLHRIFVIKNKTISKCNEIRAKYNAKRYEHKNSE